MTAAWWTGFYHQRQGTWSFSAPFGRASPSVVNRLTKAGSLLTSTSPMLSVRAMPSVSRTATSVRPSAPWWTRTTDVSKSRFTDRCNRRYAQRGKRANLGNRTRQPKGCANRIASQPQKQMAQPYRRHRMGPAQETRMDAISRTIQTHTLYSGIHPPSKGPQPDSNRQLTTHRQESQKPMRD